MDPLDVGPERGPLTPAQRWTYFLFLFGVLGLFAAEVAVNFQPVKLSALFFVLFWIPLLAVHEAGHAVTAAAVGWRVRHVVIGMGRLVHSFRVGGTSVELRLLPLEGFVRTAPGDLRAPRLKNALIYFAGAGAELLVLGAILLFIRPRELIAGTDAIGMIAVQSLAVVILVSVAFNLIPHTAGSQAGRVPNDGLGIILSFFMPLEAFAEWMDQDDD